MITTRAINSYQTAILVDGFVVFVGTAHQCALKLSSKGAI
jgi:hypothetical protein